MGASPPLRLIPREIRQRDADVDLPRRISRRAVSPLKPIAPAMPVSSLVPEVDIYDGRPPILPVRLQLLDFPGAAVLSLEEASFASVASSTSPARVLTPPGDPVSSSASRPASRGDVRCVSPVPMIVSELGSRSGGRIASASTAAGTRVAGFYCSVSPPGGVAVELPGAGCSRHFFNGHFDSHFGAFFWDDGGVPAICRPIQAGPAHA